MMSLLNKIALTKIKGIGPKLSRNLLAYCGSIEAIFDSSKKQLLTIPGVGLQLAESIASKQYLDLAEQELVFVDKHGIQILWMEDEPYPKRLKHCDDAPVLLYYKGKADLNNTHIISVVGTRNATSYGKRLCEELIEGLKPLEPLIVSGLAYGVDVFSHRSALKNDLPTVGVMGHGLDRIYPSSHRSVAAQMLAHGGLLTEFSSGTKPDKPNFPMRNRIIAGLADVTVVVEAAVKGGALITAEIANSYNRDVCAYPGSLDQPYSEGCNYLIKTNRAHLIRHADDLLYLMNWENKASWQGVKQLNLLPPSLSKDEGKVYTYLKDHVQSTIDDIALFCDWPQSKLAMILLEMEMNNLIISLPGKVYRLV